MEEYAQRLREKIAAIEDEIKRFEASIVTAKMRIAAYQDALDEWNSIIKGDNVHPDADRAPALHAAREIPSTDDRLQCIVEIMRNQNGRIIKAGALKTLLSKSMDYPFSRHHISDVLRANPALFSSPRKGYWVLREGI